jgi:phosphoserine phosphatase RsbU/P
MVAPTILLSALPQTLCDDLRELLIARNYTLSDHRLSSVPTVDFAPITAAIISLPDRLQPAIEQTRRWRVELGEHYVPILWVGDLQSTEWANVALQSGADAYLARPLDADHLAAQLHACERIRALTDHHRQRANEVPVLVERLRKSIEHHTTAQTLTRRIYQQLSTHTIPTSSRLQVAVHHRPRSRTSGDAYDINRSDSWWHILLTDTPNALAGLYLRNLAQRAIGTLEPGELFTQLNAALLALDQPESALAAAQVVVIDELTGDLGFARAAMPSIVHVPCEGPLETWSVDGPLLGVHAASYTMQYACLEVGAKLIFGTDGTIPLRDETFELSRVLLAAERHRHLPAESFVNAVALELLAQITTPDDFTLIALERPRA